MRINAAYKEGLKKILETGDMSRVRQEKRDIIFGRKEMAFWIPPMGRERANTVVKGKYSFEVSCFTGKAEIEHERAVQVTDAIKSFLARAEETQEYDEVSGDAMLALIEWQKHIKSARTHKESAASLLVVIRIFKRATKLQSTARRTMGGALLEQKCGS